MIRKIAIVLLVLVMFSFVSPVIVNVVYAADVGGWFNESFKGFDPNEYEDEDGKKLGWFESQIANTMYKVLCSVMEHLRLEPLETLIFRRPMKASSGVEDEDYKPSFFLAYGSSPEIGGIFYKNEWDNIIKPSHDFFKTAAFILLTISVIIGGLNMALKSGNPTERAQTKDMFMNWVITAFILTAMLMLVLFVFDLNSAVVVGVEDLVSERYGEMGLPGTELVRDDDGKDFPEFRPHEDKKYVIKNETFNVVENLEYHWTVKIVESGGGEIETFKGHVEGKNKIKFEWDGKLNGKKAKPGLYKYQLSATYWYSAGGGTSISRTEKDPEGYVYVVDKKGNRGDPVVITPTTKIANSLITGGSWFFTFLVYSGFIVLTIYFNILYLLRKFIIMALLIIGPLIVLAWGKGKQMSFYLWLSEMISNIFMQSAHALVFALYLMVTAIVKEGFMGSPFGKLLMLIMLVPVGMLLRQLITGWFGLLGIDEEKTAGVLMGGALGSIAAVGKMAVGAVKGGGQAVAGAVVGGLAGGPAGAAIGGVAGGLTGAPEMLGGFASAGGGVAEAAGAHGVSGRLDQLGASAGFGISSIGSAAKSIYGGVADVQQGEGGAGGGSIGRSPSNIPSIAGQENARIIAYDENTITLGRQGASPITVPASSYTGDPGAIGVGQDVRFETLPGDDGGSAMVTPVGYGTFHREGNDGYGYVETGGGVQYYVSSDNCPLNELPRDGQRVTFDIMKPDDSFVPIASNVRFV